jgi:hypothetical protein
MPASRVVTDEVTLAAYDVVAKDGVTPTFIAHVGLAQSGGTQPAVNLAIYDMSPPLHGPDYATTINVTAFGVAELNNDEIQKIRTFLDLQSSEHEVIRQLSSADVLRHIREIYTIYPHATPATQDDGRYSRMRFSCAGFVFEAYSAARIKLLDPSQLPYIDLRTINDAYPNETRLIGRGLVRHEDLGLGGDGPWPVLLCGYLLNSLCRAAVAVRADVYSVSAGDECFPQKVSPTDAGPFVS